MHRRPTPIVTVASGWAVSWNRELAGAMGNQLRAHLHAVNRKMSLRSQQLSFTLFGRSRYSTAQPRFHRAPS